MRKSKIQAAMKNVYFQKMTANGYHEIEEQIANLQKQRPAKIAQLKAARALGDLSENTEYSTAKRELRHLESRLRYLNKQLQYAEIVTPQDNQTVDLGTTVSLQFEDDNEQESYHIVGKHEADLAKQKIAFDSPLGQAILHQPAGKTVTVNAPQASYQVKIIQVTIDDNSLAHFEDKKKNFEG